MPDIPPNEMWFRKEWNDRPRYETEDPGLFVGREDFLNRLNSHFISRSGGTILISGVRGVGKTALVDRALVTSRQKLQNRYWKENWKYLKEARWWHFIDLLVRRKLLELEGYKSLDTADYLTLKDAAQRYAKSTRRWWQKLNLVDRRIRQMHEASRWQLLVLKFSASDISGALPDPGQRVTGKPRIDPEKLLRSIIRKLYVTFDSSRSEPEARVLQWSLRDKAKRQLFFETLNGAYKKSISKSYKELFTNTMSDLLKQTRSSTWEAKISWEKVGLVLLCVAVGVVFSLYSQTQPQRAWYSLDKLIAYGVPGAITGYILLSWGWKRTREKSSDQSRQSSFSYEYDYSLHQMRQDLESLVRTLSPGHDDSETHDPYRCFRRTIVIFDELDKLEHADQQLDDIITHFKNFFTLSEANFVFLTDHEFYEHLTRETVKAQLSRLYPPQHTFFTEKIYLRKPEFARFREAFFRFTTDLWLEQHARSQPADPMLVHDLLKRDETKADIISNLPMETLTQLYVQRQQYKKEQTEAIEAEFLRQQGMSKPMTVAQIWAGEAGRFGGVNILQDMRKAFHDVDGWKNAEAVSFLYHRLEDFGDTDKNTIRKTFRALPGTSLAPHKSVDNTLFTLSDLARALCFQTRNHYFDLYSAVYDYVERYEDGAPVLMLDQGNFAHDARLSSRRQQMLEIAFESAREDHPSREYFNALLIESLYRTFDKGRTGENVKIGEILFPPRDELAAVAKTLLQDEKPPTVAVAQVVEGEQEGFQQVLTRLLSLASDKLTTAQTTATQQNGAAIQVQPFTDRDAEKINRAIIRLLQLALAHDAIKSISPHLEACLKDKDRRPVSLADLEFAWNDDSYAVIRSVVREEHEKDLVKFWLEQRSELEAFAAELNGLWAGLPITGESARINTAIAELKSRADRIGLGQGTISGPDAGVLKANVGTWESREALWQRAILDRIRAENDAEVTDDIDQWPIDTATGQAVQQKLAGGTPFWVQTVIRPLNTDCAIYLLVSPLPTVPVTLAMLKTSLPEKTTLLWYVTGKETPEFTSIPEGIHVYASPLTGSDPRQGAAQLIQDYTDHTSKQRLETVITHLQASQYKDAQLAQRAGAEVLGSIFSVAGTFDAVAMPNLDVAIKLLKEKRERFITVGLSDWPDLTTSWSAGTVSKRLADEIIINGNITPAFREVIEQALSELITDPAKATADGWLKAFLAATEEPNAILTMLWKSVIRLLVRTKMDEAKLTDQSLRSAIKEHFVPWLATTTLAVAQRLNLRAVNVFTYPDAVQELEKQLKNLRANPLPATPGAPSGSASPGSRRSRKS